MDDQTLLTREDGKIVGETVLNNILFFVIDSACVIVSILFAFALKYEVFLPVEYRPYYLSYFLLAILFIPGMLMLTKVYSIPVKVFGISDVTKTSAVLVLGCILFSIANSFVLYSMPVSVLLSFFVNLTLMLVAVRILFRLRVWLRKSPFRRGSGRFSNTLIYGAGDAGIVLANMLVYDDEKRLRPIGFIDDTAQLWGKKLKGFKVFGGDSVISDVCNKYNVERIIIAIPHVSSKVIREIYNTCAQTGCHISRFSNLADITEAGLKKGTIVDVRLDDLLGRDEVGMDEETMSTLITGKTILISGGAGSIGSEICRKALEYGAEKIIIFDINENGLFEIDAELSKTYRPDKFVTALGSVREYDRVMAVFQKFHPDIVFHAAAHKHVPMMEINPIEAIVNNVFGTYNVAVISEKFKVEKFILVSTDKAVNPANVMGASKRMAELVIQYVNSYSRKTRFSAVRFGNVLGSVGSVIPTFKRQIAEGGPVTVTHREIRRYFMTIPEAVKLVFKAGAMAKGSEIFVLNMGEPVYIYDLAKTMIRLSGYTPEKDIEIKITGLRAGEKLFEEMFLEDEGLLNTHNDQIFISACDSSVEEFNPETLRKLSDITKRRDIDALYREINSLVPTFTGKKTPNITEGDARDLRKFTSPLDFERFVAN